MKIKTILGALMLLVSGQVNASVIHAIATGEIYDFVDANDILGYGGSGAAVGNRVTYHFTFNTDSAPPDFYGGARAPREADYFTHGNSTTAPSWMASSIEFDNGAFYNSDTYVGTTTTTDQVKIIERDGGSPFDYIRYHDEMVDSARAFKMGVSVYEYTENLVDGLAIDQLPVWELIPNTFLEQSRGDFGFEDFAAGWAFSGQVMIDSLTVCSKFPGGGATGVCFPGPGVFPGGGVSAVPVPAAIWLFGTALMGLVGFSKRRKAA